jgi:Mg/Co/Ni transporter MgtE
MNLNPFPEDNIEIGWIALAVIVAAIVAFFYAKLLGVDIPFFLS